MTNNRNLSLALCSFSLAVFILAKLGFLLGLNGNIFISALATVGLGFALVSLVVSLVYSFITPMSVETRKMVRGVQIASIIVLTMSLLTGGFGSLLAGYIHL